MHISTSSIKYDLHYTKPSKGEYLREIFFCYKTNFFYSANTHVKITPRPVFEIQLNSISLLKQMKTNTKYITVLQINVLNSM